MDNQPAQDVTSGQTLAFTCQFKDVAGTKRKLSLFLGAHSLNALRELPRLGLLRFRPVRVEQHGVLHSQSFDDAAVLDVSWSRETSVRLESTAILGGAQISISCNVGLREIAGFRRSSKEPSGQVKVPKAGQPEEFEVYDAHVDVKIRRELMRSLGRSWSFKAQA